MKHYILPISRALLIAAGSLVVLTIGAGCTTMLRPRVPVEASISAKSKGTPSESRLIVLLPGRHSRGSHFEREGITSQLALLPNTDVVAVDLHFGYYKNRTFLKRLREDVILPAKEKGYREIHLLGISMGGMGALFYATQYPGDVEALALFSPFVGDEEILSEIESAGGLAAWTPGEISESDYQRRLWANLSDLLRDRGGGLLEPTLWLACGAADRLLESNSFFARQFRLAEPEGFLKMEGGHDWECWRKMTRAYRNSVER